MTPIIEYTDEFYGLMTGQVEIYPDESEWYYWCAEIDFVPGERFGLEVFVPKPGDFEAVLRTRPTFQTIISKIDMFRSQMFEKIARISGVDSESALNVKPLKMRIISIFEDLSVTIEFSEEDETDSAEKLTVMLDGDLHITGVGLGDEYYF